MSGGFFYEHIVIPILNLEQQERARNAEVKTQSAEPAKKPKKK